MLGLVLALGAARAQVRILAPESQATLTRPQTFRVDPGSANLPWAVFWNRGAQGYVRLTPDVTGPSCDVDTLPFTSSEIVLEAWSRNPDGSWLSPPHAIRGHVTGPTLARIASPAPGSQLDGSAVTFTWTKGAGPFATALEVVPQPGSVRILAASGRLPGDVTSYRVSGLPTDGRVLWLRLWSLAHDGWRVRDHPYVAQGATAVELASVTAPAAGGTLGSPARLAWTAGRGLKSYRVDVFADPSCAGRPVASLAVPAGTTSLTLPDGLLPALGQPVGVQLWSELASGEWARREHTVFMPATSGRPAEIIDPAPDSLLATSSPRFRWSAGEGASAYVVVVARDAAFTDEVVRSPVLPASATSWTMPAVRPDGSPLHVRLLSAMGPGVWAQRDRRYATSRPAALLAPDGGASLADGAVHVSWESVPGVAAYRLAVGTQAEPALHFDRDFGTATTALVSGLPRDGRLLHLRLYSRIGDAWWPTTTTVRAFHGGTSPDGPTPVPVATMLWYRVARLEATAYDIGEPLALFDEQPRTLMRSAGINPARVVVDFDEEIDVSRIFVAAASGTHRCVVRAADSKADLTSRTGSCRVVMDANTRPASFGETRTIDLPATVRARAWELEVRRLNGDNFVHVYEWTMSSPTPVRFSTTVASPSVPYRRVTAVPRITPPASVAGGQLPVRVKVLVVNYDPTIPASVTGSTEKRLTQCGWNDPYVQAREYMQDIADASHGYIQMEIVDWYDVDGFHRKKDGFLYTPETYFEALRGRPHDPDRADYELPLRELGVPARVERGEVDEVWFFGGPYFGYWESAMAGRGAFHINGGILSHVPSRRPFAIMGWNYERGVDCMIHNMSHRAESTLARVYGGWSVNQLTTPWARFAANDVQSGGVAAVGTCHWPPNAQGDYDYANPRFVMSSAEDWLRYPDLTGALTPINCESWGGPDYHRNYLKWWHTRLPHVPGTTADGRQTNWWKYLFSHEHYDAAGLPLTASAPGAPVPSPPAGTGAPGPLSLSPAITPALRDHDGNGTSDLLFRNEANGLTFWWLFERGRFLQVATIGTVDPRSYDLQGCADVDGNGSADILWRDRGDGRIYVWLYQGRTFLRSVLLMRMDLSYRICGIADFDGDGHNDLLVRSADTGATYVNMLDRSMQVRRSAFLGVLATSFRIDATGDFDGDGIPDILLVNTVNGDQWFYMMNRPAGSAITVRSARFFFNLAPSYRFQGSGDFDGDGQTDLVLRNLTDGSVYFYLMTRDASSPFARGGVGLGRADPGYAIKNF